LEVGCGAGNTVFPLLQRNLNPKLKIFATDYSKIAVEVVRSHPIYQNQDILKASVWDITSDELPVEEDSVDVLTVIYVLSALHPKEWKKAIANLHRVSRCVYDWLMSRC
jgi:tRNAThr (cytosine32-N3)-methyltransferase